MVVVTFQIFDKVLQRYILPIFAKIFLPKVVVSSQHTCLTLATLFLPSIGPAPVNLLRLGPGLVTENQQVIRVDHYWRMMALDDYQQMKKILASTSDASTRLVIRLLPKCLPQTTAVSHRCKIKYVHCILRWMSTSLYYFCQAWLASWLDLVGELEDFVERFFPRGLLRH